MPAVQGHPQSGAERKEARLSARPQDRHGLPEADGAAHPSDAGFRMARICGKWFGIRSRARCAAAASGVEGLLLLLVPRERAVPFLIRWPRAARSIGVQPPDH